MIVAYLFYKLKTNAKLSNSRHDLKLGPKVKQFSSAKEMQTIPYSWSAGDKYKFATS